LLLLLRRRSGWPHPAVHVCTALVTVPPVHALSIAIHPVMTLAVGSTSVARTLAALPIQGPPAVLMLRHGIRIELIRR